MHLLFVLRCQGGPGKASLFPKVPLDLKPLKGVRYERIQRRPGHRYSAERELHVIYFCPKQLPAVIPGGINSKSTIRKERAGGNLVYDWRQGCGHIDTV